MLELNAMNCFELKMSVMLASMSSFFNNSRTISVYPLIAVQIKAVLLNIHLKFHKCLKY